MTAFLGVLVVTLAWGTLAFGAVYPWAYGPLALSGAGLGLWGLARSRSWKEGRLRGVAWALGLVGAAVAVQLIPLPIGLYRRLSPYGDRFLAQYDLGYTFQPPSWHALSTVPSQTAVALGLFVAFALLLLGLAAVVDRLPLRRLVMALAFLGVLVSVIGVLDHPPAHTYPGQFPIYGFWYPEEGGLPFAPFVNPNHYAGWMVLVIGLSAGRIGGLLEESWHVRGGDLQRWLRWLTRPEAGQVVLLSFCVLAMMAALLLTRSRSGAAALGVVLLVLALRGLSRMADVRAKVGAVVVGGLALVAVLGWVGIDPLVHKFAQAGTDASAYGRLAVWSDALRVFREFPVFGSGLNTFASIMVIDESGHRIYFSEAHNDYLQVLAEGGLLVSVAVIGLIVVLGRLALGRLRQDRDRVTSWTRVGALAGVVGMAAQSAVDFSLQMPGVTAVFVVLLAVTVHRPSDRT